ncbi:MAG TPA: hypothetical protein VGO43_06500, partial [Pyrinomonadaceae bacterium]|nr:hypothetical protein [Pyrinomonadaceae bacterium]
MRPLICPQCGGQIDEYPAGATFATCEYCSTKFLIESNKAPRAPEPTIPLGPAQPPNLDTGDPTTSFVKILGMVLGAIAVISTIAVVATQNKKPYSSSGPSVGSLFRTPSPTPVPTATPDTSILRFGERGTYDGQFDGASSIAVDKLGRIYVSDNKLRVQQFDEKGNFIKVLQVPAKGRNYDRAHSIDKIEVGTDGKLYVAVGGVILIYTENWAAAPRVVQVAPDYIQDFALKADGSMLAVSDNDRIETLIFVNKSGGITRRIEGFHTDALNAAVSPLETAAEAVRIAVDAKGNIFSVYALGALGSYTLSYNNEDLAIALLTPEAKFIRQFVPTTNVAELLAGPGGL